MSTLFADAPPPQQQSQPTLTLEDTLTHVDLSSLTQSELLLLSRRCSPAAPSDLHRSSAVLIPTIDRSTFNESAGSRRQTFCRPVHHHRSRVAVAGRLSSNKSVPVPVPAVGVDLSDDNPYHREDRSIIASLKQSLRNLPEFYDIDFNYSSPIPFSGYSSVRKRKRGRKPKTEMESENRKIKENTLDEEIVNKNGVRVDFKGLAEMEDPYGPELRRRTEGMASEEELLGFLRDLGGQWCSRRRRRKIVEAGVLGDFLPVGWKLLLGLKRKEGRAWVYCRRYISPGGRQFVSCKEVSEYLQSYFELHVVPSSSNQGRETLHQDDNGTISQGLPGAAFDRDADKQSDEHPKLTLSGADNLEDVQICDMFECHKCSMTFGKKDEYLQHLVSIHQKTTRRYRLGSSVGDGVIVKDGKFECQFCHKAFDERRRYNGHVGIHVRNYVRGVDEKPGQLTLERRTESMDKDESEARISRMDALIEIAQNSMLETSLGPSDEPIDEFIQDELNAVSGELPGSGSENELNSNFSLGRVETEGGMTFGDSHKGHLQEHNENMIADGRMEKAQDAMNVVNVKVESCLEPTISVRADEASFGQFDTYDGKFELGLTPNETLQEKDGESHLIIPLNNRKASGVSGELHSICASALAPARPAEEDKVELIGISRKDSGCADDIFAESVQQASTEDVLREESLSLLQPPLDLQTFNKISHKSYQGEGGSSGINPVERSIARNRALGLDEIEQLNLNFGGEQEYDSAPLGQIDLANKAMKEAGYGPSAQLEAQEMMFEMGGGNRLTTVCVWCGIEFSHQAEDSGIQQSDSVGYMCLACKAKISGQIGTLDGNSTMNFF